MAEVEYRFPDELLDKSEKDEKSKKKQEKDDVSVEIIDDTPAQDRNRQPLPKEMADELDKDDLSEYSEKVKQRMSQLKKAWHDERRSKEVESREKQAALAYAEAQKFENSQLKQRIGTGEKIFISEVTAAAKVQLESARAKLKAAYDAGDSGLIAAAQEEMTDAKLKMRETEGFRPSLQEEKTDVQGRPQAQTPAPDPKAESWKAKNPWFGSDSEMTAAALGLHEKLVKEGADTKSDDYYRRIDATMRRRFPENFEEAASEPARKHSTVVASASRTTAPRRIQLTTSEAAIAKRLGLTPEAYAREKIKLENLNG